MIPTSRPALRGVVTRCCRRKDRRVEQSWLMARRGGIPLPDSDNVHHIASSRFHLPPSCRQEKRCLSDQTGTSTEERFFTAAPASKAYSICVTIQAPTLGTTYHTSSPNHTPNSLRPSPLPHPQRHRPLYSHHHEGLSPNSASLSLFDGSPSWEGAKGREIDVGCDPIYISSVSVCLCRPRLGVSRA